VEGARAHEEWNKRFEGWRAQDPARAREWDLAWQGRPLPGLADDLPTAWEKDKLSTRVAGGKVMAAFEPFTPTMLGGAADLTSSTMTIFPESERFTAEGSGRNVFFGVREHAMGGAVNGLSAHGGIVRPYGSTFLQFSDYMRASVRLSALMGLKVAWVYTHDSVALGEDGPTHQPIEHLAALRAIPGLDVVRPADANETVVAWRTILEKTDGPAGLCLSRQNLPTMDRSVCGAAEGAAKGGYVLLEASSGLAEMVIISTGSEVAIALEARELLEAEGTPTRVVSMPCVEWFFAQEDSYRQTVLPPGLKARVSVEAAVAQGWRELVGESGEIVSLEHFGASAPYDVLYEQYGITAERVVAAAHSSLSKVGATSGGATGN